MELTEEVLRYLFEYDSTEPLALRWRNPPIKASRIRPGDIAGYWHPVHARSSILRRYVNVATKRRLVHHIVWIYIKRQTPPKWLGFVNADPGDCRIENLAVMPPIRHEITGETRRRYFRKWQDTFTTEEWSEYLRRRNLRRDYNMTDDQWEALRHGQNGLCAICGNPETLIRRGKLERLSIDHDHATGLIRGLLCGNCNNGLGRFGDDPACLRAAADYIERYRT